MSLIVQQLSYYHPDKELLFRDISFSVNKGQKIALTGNNGSGKSTLLEVISGKLKASSGTVSYPSSPYYVPQHFGQYDELTIAEALHIDKKIAALKAIIAGDASADNFTILDDDWDIEERALAALAFWDMESFSLTQKLANLSGGEKTKVFLSGIKIHSPSITLLDEPTNHLDSASREKLYDFIEQSGSAMLIVSHDRTLLNQLPYTYELERNGITAYGGNYEFYKAEKEKNVSALQAKLESKEKELRMARKTAREAAEGKDKRDGRGQKKKIKEGMPRIMMNTLKDKAERSTAKLKEVQAEKQENIYQGITEIKKAIPDISQMKVNFDSSALHNGKKLIVAQHVNFAYSTDNLWEEPLNFELKSGDRLSIEGGNGKGKTTLLKLITGELTPTEGVLTRADLKYIYIDQEYSIIKNELSVYGQAEKYNSRLLPEHEVKMILNRFLFSSGTWDKPCRKLSGGEKMRLALCCLMISESTPDLFILDEPTNNIDIRNIEILTATIRDYQGTVLVVSHDEYFKKEIHVREKIKL